MSLKNLISLNNSIRSIELCRFTLVSLKISSCLYLTTIGNYSSHAQQQNSKVNIISNVKENKNMQRRQFTTKRKERLSEIKRYLYSIDPIMYKSFPAKYVKNTDKVIDKLCLVDKSTAAEFVELIFNDLSKNMCFVAEANLGLGLLTTNLLEAGVPVLHVYEDEKYFLNYLYALQKKYPNKLCIRNHNLYRMPKIQYIDEAYNNNSIETMFKDVPHKVWEDESPMQIIGATVNMNFLRYLIFGVVFHFSFMLYGRTTFYIAILPSMWNAITCTDRTSKKYNSLSILFQTLFDYKYFGSIKRKSFIPWERTCSEDQNVLYVVKIEPRANIYTDYFAPAELIAYWYFVKHHFRKRTERVIPALERWIPGCGVKLIAKNVDVFTRFSDLSPDQIRVVFKEFSSCADYENSPFLASMNAFLGAYN